MLRRSARTLSYAGAGHHAAQTSEARAKNRTTFNSWYTKGSMKGGVPRIYYGWMKPGSSTRLRFEKQRNPFVDLETGTSIYYRDMRDPVEAKRVEADVSGLKGMDTQVDMYNEYKIVPDLYPEGFQWKHKLNSEYNQWRSNTWVAPDLIPPEHRGRFLCNFQLNIGQYDMRVAKFSPKDHRQWIFCCLYVGSGKGIAGWGQAVAPSAVEAKKEAIRNAFSNIIAVDLENDGPVYPIRLNVDGVRVCMYPARKIVATFRIADILCAFGLMHAGVRLNIKARNKPRTHAKMFAATFEVVRVMKSASEIAHSRGKVPHSLVSNMFPYLEEVRRRKGMFAQHPAGKDGVFAPNRAVDNRMPDHLKRGYYDDKYWHDFFAGSKEQLNEPKLGLRADQLRALVPELGSQRQKQLAQGSTRRSLAGMLWQMNKPMSSLGGLPIANPYADQKLPTHAKQTFHFN